MKFYIGFKMNDGYSYNTEIIYDEYSEPFEGYGQGWTGLKGWIIENIHKIEEVIYVVSKVNKESHMYFHEIKKVISHWKNQKPIGE